MRPRTDRQTHRRTRPQYISRRLQLTRNVILSVNDVKGGLEVSGLCSPLLGCLLRMSQQQQRLTAQFTNAIVQHDADFTFS